jgi:ribonuclease-3
MEYGELYKKLGYKFEDKRLLERALSHPSICCHYKNCENESYEKFELLGDAVLSLIILDMLMDYYNTFTEGEIAIIKSKLVCGKTLSEIALKMNLGIYVKMTKGEEKQDGRHNRKILEDVIEAIIGAMYEDSRGIEEPRKFIKKYWEYLLFDSSKIKKDAKTRLQEWSQKNKKNIPEYNLVGTEGTEGSPIFEIEISVESLPKLRTKAKSKKEAEIKLATEMIEYIKNNISDKI